MYVAVFLESFIAVLVWVWYYGTEWSCPGCRLDLLWDCAEDLQSFSDLFTVTAGL